MEEKQEIIKLRNHFTYILEQMWKVLVYFALILIGNGDEETIEVGLELIQSGNIVQGLLVMGGMFLLMLLICLWYVNRWYRTTITIQDGTITSTKATLNRRVNTMAVANISNINMEQNLFEMLVGTYKLKMDTNSLSTAETTDLEIVLKKKKAMEVKQLILAMLREIQGEEAGDVTEREMVQQGQAVRDSFDDSREEYDIVYSVEEILKNGLVTMSVMECLIAIGLVGSAVFSVVTVLGKGGDIILILSTVLLQIVVAGSVMANFIRKWLQDFQFRARRDRDKIYVSCGLLKKKSYVVPIDKINAVTLQYTFIGRICKRAYVKVINIGGQGEEANGMKLLLADSYEELEQKLSILLPEYRLPEINGLTRPPKRLMGIFRLCAVLYGAAASFGFVCAVYAFGEDIDITDGIIILADVLIGILIAGFSLYISSMYYRASGILCGSANLVISKGIFAKAVRTIPYEKIQYLHTDQGPIKRMLGLMQGNVSILASAMSRIQVIGTFDVREFDELERKLRETY